MRTRQLTLLGLVFFVFGVTGCDKTSGEKHAEKKIKEDLRKGTFHNPPAKSFQIGQ